MEPESFPSTCCKRWFLSASRAVRMLWRYLLLLLWTDDFAALAKLNSRATRFLRFRLDHTPSPLCTLQILPLQIFLNHWHASSADFAKLAVREVR